MLVGSSGGHPDTTCRTSDTALSLYAPQESNLADHSEPDLQSGERPAFTTHEVRKPQVSHSR